MVTKENLLPDYAQMQQRPQIESMLPLNAAIVLFLTHQLVSHLTSRHKKHISLANQMSYGRIIDSIFLAFTISRPDGKA